MPELHSERAGDSDIAGGPDWRWPTLIACYLLLLSGCVYKGVVAPGPTETHAAAPPQFAANGTSAHLTTEGNLHPRTTSDHPQPKPPIPTPWIHHHSTKKAKVAGKGGSAPTKVPRSDPCRFMPRYAMHAMVPMAVSHRDMPCRPVTPRLSTTGHASAPVRLITSRRGGAWRGMSDVM